LGIIMIEAGLVLAAGWLPAVGEWRAPGECPREIAGERQLAPIMTPDER
jgi:hypothetical protein